MLLCNTLQEMYASVKWSIYTYTTSHTSQEYVLSRNWTRCDFLFSAHLELPQCVNGRLHDGVAQTIVWLSLEIAREQ